MRPECREEVVLIEAGTLMATLENYLRKHRYVMLYPLISLRM